MEFCWENDYSLEVILVFVVKNLIFYSYSVSFPITIFFSEFCASITVSETVQDCVAMLDSYLSGIDKFK